MINIEVNTKVQGELLDPVEIYGSEHGKVFQQYSHGKPEKCFAIGAGVCERPIDIWWDNETHRYRLSSSTKKDLKDFLPHIKYMEIKADVNINITMQ